MKCWATLKVLHPKRDPNPYPDPYPIPKPNPDPNLWRGVVGKPTCGGAALTDVFKRQKFLSQDICSLHLFISIGKC